MIEVLGIHVAKVPCSSVFDGDLRPPRKTGRGELSCRGAFSPVQPARFWSCARFVRQARVIVGSFWRVGTSLGVTGASLRFGRPFIHVATLLSPLPFPTLLFSTLL